MPVVRWTFYDPVEGTTSTVPLNPSEGGTPAQKKNITSQTLAAPDSHPVLFEGQDEVQTIQCKGTILTEQHLNYLQNLFGVRHQLLLTDDLGREMWVYCSEFTPTRQRSHEHPFLHDYTITFYVLDVQ